MDFAAHLAIRQIYPNETPLTAWCPVEIWAMMMMLIMTMLIMTMMTML